MKCIRCGRPLSTAALMLGPHALGPKCAKILGLVAAKPAQYQVVKNEQADLFDFATAEHESTQPPLNH